MDDESLIKQNPKELYELIQQVGSGSYGTVHQALNLETSEILAAKIMNVQDDDDFKPILKEIHFLQKMSDQQNENIVNYKGAYYNEEDREIWILMEYCALGAVNDLMRDATRVLSEGEAAFVTRSMLLGLDFLHQRKIQHRDLKANNLLVSEEGVVKLADFGVSKQLDATFNAKGGTVIGTPYWMAPEIIRGEEQGLSGDIWSVGIVLYELLVGKPPFAHLHPMRAMMMIPNEPPPTLAGQKSVLGFEFSAACNDFLAMCTDKVPRNRWNIAQLLEHPFMKQASSLQQLMDKNPPEDINGAPATAQQPNFAAEFQQIAGKEEVIEEFASGTVVRKPQAQEEVVEEGAGNSGTVVRKPNEAEKPKAEKPKEHEEGKEKCKGQ